MTYNKKLITSCNKTGTCACMGLDPVVSALPVGENITSFFKVLFEEMKRTNTVPSAFKPNIGYYTVLDSPYDKKFQGSIALAEVICMIRNYFPGIPVILDSKRGDIATSSKNYATEAFDVWKADSVTVSPYMGSDSVGPFASFSEEKGVYVLNRTSNPGGRDLQNILQKNSEPLYLAVSENIRKWKTGAVVGATNLNELKDIITCFSSDEVPVLIPGAGSQGGSAEAVMDIIKKAGYRAELARINSSSNITHPWVKKGQKAPENWLEWSLGNLDSLIKECRC